MAFEYIFGIVIVVSLVAIAAGRLIPKRKPPSSVFVCARCGTASRHSERTIEAFRRGKDRFFCQTCHAKWLQSRPADAREQLASTRSSARSGCLGAVALFTLLPLGSLATWLIT